MEIPIRFPNRKGEHLFGMLFGPDNTFYKKKIGILISVNAIKYRIGTYRLHTILARHLCAEGYHVMYFDPAGIGDSEGFFEEKLLQEHYLDIQQGKYSNDIEDAFTYFHKNYPVDEVVFLGLCGGAISMLIAAARNRRVNGLILLAAPVLLETIIKNKRYCDQVSAITSSGQAKRTLIEMAKKIGKRQTWMKILTGKIQFELEGKSIFKSLNVIVGTRLRRLKYFFCAARSSQYDILESAHHPRFNNLFKQSFVQFVSNHGKVLFVFGELDGVTWDFKSEFGDTVLARGNPFEGSYKICVIKEANHIFSAKESQVELKSTIDQWLINELSREK